MSGGRVIQYCYVATEKNHTVVLSEVSSRSDNASVFPNILKEKMENLIPQWRSKSRIGNSTLIRLYWICFFILIGHKCRIYTFICTWFWYVCCCSVLSIWSRNYCFLPWTDSCMHFILSQFRAVSKPCYIFSHLWRRRFNHMHYEPISYSDQIWR